MLKFIHTGDLHLGLKFKNVSFDRDKALNRRRELWSTFERIVDYARERADFLFIAGDLFEEEYFTMADIERVRDILKSAPNIHIIISAGNHDFKGQKSLYKRVDWPENVSIFGNKLDKKDFPDHNAVVYGYSWDKTIIRETKLLDDLKDRLDPSKNNILVLHGDVANKSDYLPLNLKSLEALNMDYIALGHIHKPEILSHKIAYCGCPEPLDFGETGPRGIIEGHISNKKTKIEFIEFSQRSFLDIRLDLNESMGYQEIVSHISNIDIGKKEKDFYRLRLEGFIQRDIDIDDIKRDLEDKFYHLEIINNTSPEYDLEDLEENYRDNIISHFIGEMKEKGLEDPIVKRALYLGLNQLLKGD